MEATGDYENAAFVALSLHGLPVAIVNRGARSICEGNEIGWPRPTKSMRHASRSLPAVLKPRITPASRRRRRRIEFLAPEGVSSSTSSSRRRIAVLALPFCGSDPDSRAKRSVEEHIEWLEKKSGSLTSKSAAHRELTSLEAEGRPAANRCPGVGPTTSAKLLAHLPELRKPRSEADCGSGRPRALQPRQRPKERAPAHPRRQSLRKNSPLHGHRDCCHTQPIAPHFPSQLLAAGKAGQVALTACMRKLLTILNAMIRDNRPWATVNP